MIRNIGRRIRTNSSQVRFQVAVLLGLLFAVATLIQSQSQTKPSDVFFGDPSEMQILEENATPVQLTSIGQEVGKNYLSPHSIIAKDVVLRGWLAKDPSQDRAGNPISDAVFVNFSPIGAGITDLHYNIVLDYDFISPTYGANAGVLAGAVLHGHGPDTWSAAATPIPVKNPLATTASGIDINSFWQPYSAGNPSLEFHTELNAWHPDSSQRGCQWPLPGTPVLCSTHNFEGRGPAPAGWIEKDYGPVETNSSHNWWPFDPLDPDGLHSIQTTTSQQPGPDYAKYQACFQNCAQRARNSGGGVNCADPCKKQFPKAFVNVSSSVNVPKNLQPGEYVEIKGTLWQDITHATGGPPAQYCWNEAPFQNHGGWLEIHPVDALKRVPAPAKDGVPIPSPVKYVKNTDPNGDPPWIQATYLEAAQKGAKRIITAALCADAQGRTVPDPADVSGVACPDDNPTMLVPHFLPELTDGRFTDMFLLSHPEMLAHGIQVDSKRPDCVNITARLAPGVKSAHFKATYVVWWTPPAAPAIINQPANSVVGLGQSARFAVTASGAMPLNYQWRRNGMAISGATSPNYVTPQVTPSDLGAQFAVVVSNSVGSVTSSTAAILGQLSATVSSAGPNSPVTDTVTVTSGGTPLGGVTVTVGNSTFVTNASGVAVFTHTGCVKWNGPVPKVGDTKISSSTPVPCNWTGSASKAGYQTISFMLP